MSVSKQDFYSAIKKYKGLIVEVPTVDDYRAVFNNTYDKSECFLVKESGKKFYLAKDLQPGLTPSDEIYYVNSVEYEVNEAYLTKFKEHLDYLYSRYITCMTKRKTDIISAKKQALNTDFCK